MHKDQRSGRFYFRNELYVVSSCCALVFLAQHPRHACGTVWTECFKLNFVLTQVRLECRSKEHERVVVFLLELNATVLHAVRVETNFQKSQKWLVERDSENRELDTLSTRNFANKRGQFGNTTLKWVSRLSLDQLTLFQTRDCDLITPIR